VSVETTALTSVSFYKHTNCAQCALIASHTTNLPQVLKMNTESAQESLKALSSSISDLEKQLQPLLTSALSDSTKKLPLLDRAKLYITIVYAIESLIFCRLAPTTRPHH
jgi:hypothetical protein